MTKPLKITGDLKYLSTIVPAMMERIERGGGINVQHAKNHHTVLFEMSDGFKIKAFAYETKSLIIIEWSAE